MYFWLPENYVVQFILKILRTIYQIQTVQNYSKNCMLL